MKYSWQRLLHHPHGLGLALVVLLPLSAELGRTQAMPAFASAWIWPASGLCLAYLWVYGRPYWPYVFLGTAVTLIGIRLPHPLLYLINPLLAALAAWVPVRLMGTLQDQHRLSLARTLWGLLLYGIVLATALRSGLNAVTLLLLGIDPPQLFSVRLPAWGASSALGVLLIVVPVMGWLLRLEAGRHELQRAGRPVQALLWMLPMLLLEALRLAAPPDAPWAVAALAAGVLMQLAYSWRFGGRWGSLLVLAVAVQIGFRLPLQGPLELMLLPALQTWVQLTVLALLNLAVMVMQSHWGTRIELLQQGLHGGGVLAWWWQPQSNRYGTAGDWQALSGRGEAAPPRHEALFERVLPEDRDALQAAHERRLAGDAVACEFRLLDDAGRTRWLRETGEVVRRDATGQPLHVAGLLQDISASRDAREQLALSEQRYRTLSSVAPVGVFQSRLDGECLYVNAEYAAMLGSTPERCLGMGWTRHLLDPDWHGALEGWRQATAQGLRFEGESQMRRSDGRLIWVMARAQPVRNAAGQVESYVGSLTDISEQKAQQELIWQQAHVDALTGLPNRRLFTDRLDQSLQHAQRHGQRLALLYIDLDRFKEVNDTLGHATGDRLLVAAAQRIHDSVRASDTTARLGGDEFTVVLADLHGSHPVDAVAGKLIEALSKPFVLGDDTVYVSASVGITLFPDDGQTVLELMKHADQALYRAKAEGRNRFCYFTSAMQAQAQLVLSLTQELRAALDTEQLQLHFQPIVDLASGRLVKAEALLRWQHPQRGAVSPAQFVPLAEESGLIHPLGDWVFAQALRASLSWQARHGSLLPINVNKSPRQFLAGDTEQRWPAQLREAGLPVDAVCVEITEGLLLDDRPDVVRRVHALAQAGVPFALDDFGTGYSAMAYLKKFPIQQLKIDRSFVHGMADSPADLAIVEAIVAMAHKLGLVVVAEGVETEAQAQLLRAAGCDLAQGWLFGRPMPLADLLALQSSAASSPSS